ncbi:DoxX family membrane protein [Ginsengibacter hankyongi]|uniref:DoxX family membrane protein n=1 Tax=Ginsengibacter hankyongi TaxID=2607284 RepID=A0A5J5IGT5_9BACT|nr:DoxX family membrane protein [Ginsengibacter hankyongi]KAA9038184.1 DoxX family membrane protein [Ginsengibacter hankyongi]
MQSKVPSRKTPAVFSAFSILRISVGVVYFWFGALKFFQGLSPAEQLAMQTIHKITFGFINDRLNIIMLASWECLIGVFLIIGKWIKPALMLLFLHMVCTFSPFIFFPDQVFHIAPYGLSLTGQYIVKNIIIIAAGLVLWKVETQKAISSEVSSIVSKSEEFMQGKKIREHSVKEYAINDNGISN